MKLSLNLGCGDRYADDWVNVDHGSPHQKDLDVDLTGELPWELGSVSRVYAGHLLEHITEEQCVELARRLLMCMDPVGGVLVAVGPDLTLAEQMVRAGTFDHTYHSLDALRYGAGRWAGDVHLWETTGPRVAGVMHRAGWPVVHVLDIDLLEDGWPVVERQWQWQYAVRCWAGET